MLKELHFEALFGGFTEYWPIREGIQWDPMVVSDGWNNVEDNFTFSKCFSSLQWSESLLRRWELELDWAYRPLQADRQQFFSSNTAHAGRRSFIVVGRSLAMTVPCKYPVLTEINPVFVYIARGYLRIRIPRWHPHSATSSLLCSVTSPRNFT